jgi:hypothetical protein
MENRIIDTKLIEWRKIKPLQPDNLKIIYNYKHIEQSILKNGFSMPFFVWEDGKDIYAIDGHSRIEVLSNMENVPEKLPATFINAKDKKEAIEILLEVFNQKQNPIAEEVLIEWLEVEDVEVNVDALNVKIQYNSDDIDLDKFFEEGAEQKEQKNKIILEYTEEDYNLVIDAFSKHSGSKEQIVFKLLGL